MALLYNRVNRNEMKQRLMEETFKRKTISFYRYVRLEDPSAMRERLFIMWRNLNCFGRIYVANEGINAQMSIPEENYEAFLMQLNTVNEFANVPIKIAVEDDGKSFFVLTVKVKTKLVADGLADDYFDVTNVGKHLTAKEFNEAMQQPNTLVVDMRNQYESEVGHFEGAILPEIDTFKDQLPLVAEMLESDKDKKVLLYCTGGIRCEKASAYFKHLGFSDVNQLHGGIIDYVRQVKSEGLDNKFRGKNFVFDQRLGERVSDEIISTCHQCATTCDTHVNCANDICHLLLIQCESCATKNNGCCSEECQQIFLLPEEQKVVLRRNAPKMPHNFHHKKRMLANG